MSGRNLDARQKLDGYDKLSKKLCCCEQELAAVLAGCPPCPPHLPTVFQKNGITLLTADGIAESCQYRVTLIHFGVPFAIFATEGPKTLAEIVGELAIFFATLPVSFAFAGDFHLVATITSYYTAAEWDITDELECI